MLPERRRDDRRGQAGRCVLLPHSVSLFCHRIARFLRSSLCSIGQAQPSRIPHPWAAQLGRHTEDVPPRRNTADQDLRASHALWETSALLERR